MDVPCILCRESGCVYVSAEDGFSFRCSDCEDTFTADDVKNFIDSWVGVLAWLETHPARKGVSGGESVAGS